MVHECRLKATNVTDENVLCVIISYSKDPMIMIVFLVTAAEEKPQ